MCSADGCDREVVNNGTSNNTIPCRIDEREFIDKEVSRDTGVDLDINTSVDGRTSSNVEIGSSSMVMTRIQRTEDECQNQEEDQRQYRKPNSPRTASR